MKLAPKRWLAVCLVAGLAASLAGADVAPSAQRLTPEHFTQIHALVKPKADEDAWAQIPWMTSLWQARKRAAAEGKPILLWEMDGHPLGCT
jgi:hypothetical protein